MTGYPDDLPTDAGLPSYRLLTAIVAVDEAERIIDYCARTELPAKVRAHLTKLGEQVGWTQTQVMLGVWLVNALDIIEALDDQPKEDT